MAKAPRPGSTTDQPEIVVVIDGEKYPFRLSEITARDSGALRSATGMSLRAIMSAAKTDPDIDVIAALVWLSRRQHGEKTLAYDDVAAEIGYDTTFDLEGVADAEDPDSPEASAG